MELHKFDYLHEMEIMLADNISKELEASINQLGKASLLVSGGTSPKGLFQILSKKAIDWSKVTVGLVDERFVSNENEASNEKLVNENLLINLASKAKFLSMVHKIEDEKENLKLVNLAYSPFFKDLTVVVLGMGEDGHTASLFPNDENSENDLKSSKTEIISTFAPVNPKNRISCSKSMILESKSLYLMLIGPSKIEVLENAKQNNYPISHFFRSENEEIKVFFAEKK